MSGISFEGIGEVTATFAVSGAVKVGEMVKMVADNTVSSCEEGDWFCGVALAVKNGLAAVQIGGVVEVDSSDSLSAGWAELVANSTGGVLQRSGGISCLVISAENDRAVVRL